MTYSVDFRRRALEIKEKFNLTYSETSRRLGVGSASLIRWNKEPEPQKHRNKPATIVNPA